MCTGYCFVLNPIYNSVAKISTCEWMPLAFYSLRWWAACVDKQYTFHLCKEVAFVGFVSLICKTSTGMSSGFQMGSFHISGPFQAKHWETFWKTQMHIKEGRTKWVFCHLFPFCCCGFKKNTVVFGYFVLLQASLQKFAQNYSLIWNTEETICHHSPLSSFTVEVLRSTLSANSKHQQKVFPG